MRPDVNTSTQAAIAASGRELSTGNTCAARESRRRKRLLKNSVTVPAQYVRLTRESGNDAAIASGSRKLA